MDTSTQKSLSEAGRDRIDWAQQCMPVLRLIRERFEGERPFEGVRIAACLHVTAETAVLARCLKAGGAELRLCASNPLSTQDDVVASLTEHDSIEVFAARGADRDTYYQHIRESLEHHPQLTMDDGADLVRLVHTDRRELLDEIIGGTEETTTGVTRLRSMARESVLQYPVIAVNDARTKHRFDNRYGTGQSSIDGILRATNRLLAGSTFVVCGYGSCGRGVASRAAGMGARVMVTEVDPLRALEAAMDGYQVQPIADAARIGDYFCTVTGNEHVIGEAQLQAMKDGAIMCNAGHFDVELDVRALDALAVGRRSVREGLEEFRFPDGKRLYLLGEGRLVNLATAEGHPPDVMDMSFANQALAAELLVRHATSLEPGVHAVPDALDRDVARLKLEAMGISIDTMTQAQRDYSEGWKQGT